MTSVEKAALLDRIQAQACPEPNSGCLLWMGSLVDKKGYARISVKGRQQKVHRLHYALVNGPIPSGMRVCHKCDVPSCVNPDHLFLGTQGDNVADMMRKGRHRAPRGEASPHARLTEKMVREIRASTESAGQISRRLGIPEQTIFSARSGRSWAHVQ